jgi:hypothetical protein
MAMSYLMARDFEKAKTPEEKMNVFLKHGFTEDRLREEIRELCSNGSGVARADYNDSELVRLCMEMVESGVRVLSRGEPTDPREILEDERFKFYSSLESSRSKELRTDPVYQFNLLIADYLALTISPFGP